MLEEIQSSILLLKLQFFSSCLSTLLVPISVDLFTWWLYIQWIANEEGMVPNFSSFFFLVFFSSHFYFNFLHRLIFDSSSIAWAFSAVCTMPSEWVLLYRLIWASIRRIDDVALCIKGIKTFFQSTNSLVFGLRKYFTFILLNPLCVRFSHVWDVRLFLFILFFPFLPFSRIRGCFITIWFEFLGRFLLLFESSLKVGQMTT